MSDLSISPDVSYQQGALANGVLNTVFPPSGQGRQAGQFLYLYDKDRLLFNVNNNGSQLWKELLVIPPRGTALGADEAIGTATVVSGTNSITVNNALVTPNSVILITAVVKGLQAAAPVQATISNQIAGAFDITIYNFAGALTNLTADAVIHFLIL